MSAVKQGLHAPVGTSFSSQATLTRSCRGHIGDLVALWHGSIRRQVSMTVHKHFWATKHGLMYLIGEQ